jgi:hypothetical protein
MARGLARQNRPPSALPAMPGPSSRVVQKPPFDLTYVAAMNGNRRQWMFRIDPICFFVSVIKIRTGLGFLKGGTE